MAKKVLIIDDDKMVLNTLKRLLTKEGYKISLALSGIEALEQIKQCDFDLIISDIKMPGMDGVETVKRIRNYLAEKNKSPIPEIFITAYAKEEIYQEAVALRASAYIEKPFDMKSLLESTKKAVEK